MSAIFIAITIAVTTITVIIANKIYYKVGTFPVLQMRKLRHERLNNFLQGDITGYEQERFSNLGSLTPSLMLLMATIYCLYKEMSGINVSKTVIIVSNSLLSYFLM